MKNKACRPIKSDLKSHRIVPETEKSSRWNFFKILREYSTLREFYPDIDPYAEVYRFRENMYAIFSEGLSSGTADTWNFLIIGPEKAMLIDTGCGVGNLRGLCEFLAPGKEIVCVNTHHHLDHSGGNPAFEKVYIHEYDVPHLLAGRAHIQDHWLDEKGQPKETWFDVADLVPYRDYEIIGFKDGDTFDLGEGYLIEVKHLPGHTPGQSAFYDRQSKCIYIGDNTSCFGGGEGEAHPECCTVRALRDALKAIEPLFDEISGVFAGHGTIDQHPLVLQYLMDTADRILAHPDWYDNKVDFGGREMMAKFIYQYGSDLKYTMAGVEMRD